MYGMQWLNLCNIMISILRIPQGLVSQRLYNSATPCSITLYLDDINRVLPRIRLSFVHVCGMCFVAMKREGTCSLGHFVYTDTGSALAM